MSQALAEPPTTAPAAPAGRINGPLYRFTHEQYHRLIDIGILKSGDRVEFVEGILFHKMTRNAPHVTTVRRLRREISTRLPTEYFFDSEAPITLSDGEPEPDGVVIRGRIDDFQQRHPGPAEVVLIIEVSDTAIRLDRGTKLRSYARAGIGTYWIIKLDTRELELHTDPQPTLQPEPAYANRRVLTAADAVPLQVGDVAVSIPISTLLPPA